MYFPQPTRTAALLMLTMAPAVAQQAPAPQGKVLFEHHEPPIDTTPVPDPPATATPAQPPSLRRRLPASPSTGTDLPQQPPLAMSSSFTELGDPILITPADREQASRISSAERSANTVTATELDLHLDTHTGITEARAQLTIRNTGPAPLAHLTLRISGALRWESARLNNAAQPLTQYNLPDDLDHTGVATELALTPQQPLAPGTTAALDLYYTGALTTSAQRLLNLGAPAERATRTDWDNVSDTFTGLRGLGNVLWYPVTQPPANLQETNDVPQAVENARIANADAPFALHLTLQYTGAQPQAAFFCGERQHLEPLAAQGNRTNNEGGAVTAGWNLPALGPHTPSLFVAGDAPQAIADGLLRVVTSNKAAAAALAEAATSLQPMLSDWLGAAPLQPLDIIDLPIPGAAAFTDGPFLVAPLTTASAATLAPFLAGPLTAAWLPRNLAAPWLREGITAFLQTVWAERTAGRTAALSSLAAMRTQLNVLATPQPSISGTAPAARSSPNPSGTALSASASQPFSSSSPAEDRPGPTGPPLATCTDPACARVKAAYVFQMLRTMLGDAALQQALSGWRVAIEKTQQSQAAAVSGARVQTAAAPLNSVQHQARTQTAALEALLQRVAGKRNLSWFFQSWIDADHGLPELSIVTVAPRRVERNAPTDYLPPKQAVGGPIGPEPVPRPGDPESTARPSSTPGNRIAPAPGSWLVAVEVQNTGGADAEVPVTVRSGSLTNTLPLRVPAHSRATVRVPFEAGPEEVLVNDGTVPEATDTSQHRRSITLR